MSTDFGHDADDERDIDSLPVDRLPPALLRGSVECEQVLEEWRKQTAADARLASEQPEREQDQEQEREQATGEPD
jgi:hypothetical protein